MIEASMKYMALKDHCDVPNPESRLVRKSSTGNRVQGD